MSTPTVVNITAGSQIPSGTRTYVVDKELGEGGFGNVYRVKSGNESFALKLTKMWTFMPNERLEYAKRFKQEYEYGSRLQSKNLVKSYDYNLLEGNPYIVMDLCSGGSLRDWVGQNISFDQLEQVAYGILCGLADLHNEGIIHRDIKPENVLFNEQKTPMLADFGISASIKKRHTIANFMGHAKEVFATGTYSPPEQIDPKKAMKVMGPTNDIYAFGAMMYELFTAGHLPFGSFDDFLKDMASYEKKKKEENWNRQTLRMKAPSKWEQIIERCIKSEPELRFQTVDEILSELGFAAARSHKTNVTAHSKWILRVQNGEEIGRTYFISNLARFKQKNLLTIGWFNEENPFTNDLGITEEFTQYISNFHATLEYNPQTFRWTIKDGQWRQKDGVTDWYPSTNGVLVNGRKTGIHGMELEANDIISIGDTTLKVIIE
ncbi:protein kinase [bacterium]|nr:protein kinase [bacterium]